MIDIIHPTSKANIEIEKLWVKYSVKPTNDGAIIVPIWDTALA